MYARTVVDPHHSIQLICFTTPQLFPVFTLTTFWPASHFIIKATTKLQETDLRAEMLPFALLGHHFNRASEIFCTLHMITDRVPLRHLSVVCSFDSWALHSAPQPITEKKKKLLRDIFSRAITTLCKIMTSKGVTKLGRVKRLRSHVEFCRIHRETNVF